MAVSLAKTTFVATCTFESGRKTRKNFTDRQVAWDWANAIEEANRWQVGHSESNPVVHIIVSP